MGRRGPSREWKKIGSRPTTMSVDLSRLHTATKGATKEDEDERREMRRPARPPSSAAPPLPFARPGGTYIFTSSTSFGKMSSMYSSFPGYSSRRVVRIARCTDDLIFTRPL